MTSYVRKFLALLATGALLIGVLTYLPGDSVAANLTGGTYTYVINGEEANFPVDPLNQKAGLLLPTEVFESFGIQLTGTLSRKVTLKREAVTLGVTVGVPAVEVGEKTKSLPTFPVRLNGRVFLPADLLQYFGIEYILDGNFLSMRDGTSGQTVMNNLDDKTHEGLLQGLTFSNSVRADSNIYLNANFLVLTQEIVRSSGYDVDYGTRVRLLNLLATNTLVQVKLSNTGVKSGGLATAGLFLVDANRRQYDLASVFDLGEGLVSAKLAPGADRTGVLVFPKVPSQTLIYLYYDNNGAILGTVTNP